MAVQVVQVQNVTEAFLLCHQVVLVVVMGRLLAVYPLSCCNAASFELGDLLYRVYYVSSGTDISTPELCSGKPHAER